MKTTTPPRFFLSITFGFLILKALPVTASPGRGILETVEQISRVAGRRPPPSATEALQEAVEREGSATFDVTRRTGVALPEAAARVPEAAQALASRSDTLLTLARKHGEEALRLEARLPGMGKDATRHFPSSDDLRRLNALPIDDARGIIAFAAHATDTTAPGLLLDAVEAKGGGLLRQLDSRKILALGLSSGMVIAASGGAVSVASASEEFTATLGKLGFPVAASLALGVLTIGSVSALALAARLGIRIGKRDHSDHSETSRRPRPS